MKKLYVLFFTITSCILILSASATAATTGTQGAFTYEINGSKATITRYDDSYTFTPYGKVSVPEKINSPYNVPVTAIGDNAFLNCSNIKELTMPSTIESVGNSAFSGCRSLNTIVFSSNLKTIGNSAFTYSALTTLTIPSKVTKIGNSAFYGCQVLKTVSIPASVTSIGESVFEFCTALQSIDVNTSNKYYYSNDGILYKTSGNVLIAYPALKADTEFTIPSNVTAIAANAFNQATYLKKVNFNYGLRTIGDSAFSHSSITSAALPETLTQLGTGAFEGCKTENVYLPAALTDWGENAFAYCEKLKSVTISEGITNIGDSAFLYCPIEEIDIPSTVKTIGAGAFRGTRIKTVTIPHGVTVINGGTFRACKYLESIYIPETVKKIYEYVIYQDSILKDVYYSGTEDEWNQIDIHSLNEFSKATIHYRYGVSYTETVATDTGFSVTPVLVPDNSNVIVVCYLDKKPVWIKNKTSFGNQTLNFDFDSEFDKNYDEVKIFVFNSYFRLKPITKAESLK